MPSHDARRPEAHIRLDKVLDAARVVSERMKIPAEMITLHGRLRDATLPEGATLQGPGQHTLRWGAFMLAYAPLEAFFNAVLPPTDNRPMPLNVDKIRQTAQREHDVSLFTKRWSLCTLVPPTAPESGQYCEWRRYRGTEETRTYLADMKSLRDRLSHGADPFSSTNRSGAMWSTQKGPSLRMMGVEVSCKRVAMS
ncbi:hypothetical protein [Agromyces laixinhei]|uniref:hypothetical protein n=1 Tax=Agromyces laixinhei TaxID=2585717 RepID=UPI0011168292|nr:hypothetical protein [Agromyces laixinhei]